MLPWAVPAIHRHPTAYRAMCHAAPAVLLLGWLFPTSSAARVAAAISLSAYALAESSITNSHRDYANVYSAWALALLPNSHAEGVALGACGLLIAGSGYGKLVIGGLLEWGRPSTLRAVLKWYGSMDIGSGGPASPVSKGCGRGGSW
mmetsp:Transcript_19001/g.56521  ORF Transcript_19001/g.56521 Transcript_19001/m.56521 type:complete len:147 (-) Transcript_19001:2527-2967(-)